MNLLSDPNRSVLLSPPEEGVDDSDEAVVEHEWDETDSSIIAISVLAFDIGPLDVELGKELLFYVDKLKSSIQTIRELTEVRK